MFDGRPMSLPPLLILDGDPPPWRHLIPWLAGTEPEYTDCELSILKAAASRREVPK